MSSPQVGVLSATPIYYLTENAVRPDIGIEDARVPGWRDQLPISGPVPLPFPSMPWLMNGSHPHTPTKGELCDADTKVNQAIASLMTVDMVVVGIITVSVTGWWSARSDMWGRRPICALASFANVLTYVILATFS